MIKDFKEALDAGLVEPVRLPDGKFLECEGVRYYQASSEGINMGISRWYVIGDIFRRHDEMKLSEDLLRASVASTKSLLKRVMAQVNLDAEQVLDAAREALMVQERVEQRINLGLTLELVYEIAGVYFFAEDENPHQVDSDKRRRNSRRFMAKPELYPFFLQLPLSRFVPLQQLFHAATLNSWKETNELAMLDWALTRSKLKLNGADSATIQTISSQLETLYGLDGLLDRLSKDTTTLFPPGSETSSDGSNLPSS